MHFSVLTPALGAHSSLLGAFLSSLPAHAACSMHPELGAQRGVCISPGMTSPVLSMAAAAKAVPPANGTAQEDRSLPDIPFGHTHSYSHEVIISLIENGNSNAAKDAGRVADCWGLPEQPTREERAVSCESSYPHI